MPELEEVSLGLVGGGMFGGDVVLRSIEDLERCGIAPYLGRVGLDHRARLLAPLRFRLAAIGTRTPATAERLCRAYRERVPGASPLAYHGEEPWRDIFEKHDVDVLFVATPDHLHVRPAIHALERGAHVLIEKPLALSLSDADAIIRLAREKGLVAGVDMHKRYDPCHRFLFQELCPRIGTPLYARAVLEEPLEVSTQVFQWAAASNPFSYVGVHWVDLFSHYLSLEPASLHAVGQKELLARWDKEGGSRPIDAFDSMQVSVDYRGGLRVYYVASWVNPKEFEGPVNQEMEITGTRGKIEFDQQYRGLRAVISGVGSRTFNPHFSRNVMRAGPGAEGAVHDGYGKDSIIAVVARAMEVRLGLATARELRGTYPDAESSRTSVAIIEAAAEVARRNLEHLRAGRGAPVTARFAEGAYEVVDPVGRGGGGG
jgi:predicted dehydrogenase